ncbi:DUF459 domain-containing protein [Bradyrhizobium jicamae]|uniref:DUF459 domain-containing protein n=1 Tax=Bradyrhizobium jicamae TaxID=280332 RepID=A0ABS5FM36_9BRAD|nr:SGNH family hydrolase [Bradyrhizobium jicamae]MBR0797872.1 DUF459 domain-containing protein [Bradyrhizobium jicamae]MBR0935933.1 DUF459 domain-containing protein [Bradyrhizobium jicamae]
MPKPRSFLHVFTEAGPLVTLLVALALLFGIAAPASAQFFSFPGFGNSQPRQAPPPRERGGGGWFGSDFFQPFQQQQPQQIQRPREDFSRAPAPAKRETVAERNVLVLGDAMADWLAYGLEDAYSDQPDMGVIRKHKTVSGLIRYQPKGDPADWAAAAKGILATENPDAIVVMLGLNDRIAMHEPAVEKKTDAKDDKKDARAKPAKPGEAKPGDAKTDAKTDAKSDAKSDTKAGDAKPDAAAKTDNKPVDTELSPDDAADSDTPQLAAPGKTARTPNGVYEFRDDRWVELYSKKIEEMINVLKSKGVPVLWVGLPAIRGPKGTSDMLFLDALYRDAAGKAGITYVDVWDGFVDEAGRFMAKGPDFEGQPRKLRSDDGVFFTKPGARKLAHYVEREVTRLLAARSGPIALPSEPATPEVSAEPGKPPPRPLAGPILPLVASSVGTDQLLGGPGSRPAAVDALAARTLVKGEPLAPPAGRADDFAWPRREIGREQAKGDVPVAATTPVAPASANPPPTTTAIAPDGSIITAPQKPAPRRVFRPTHQAQPVQPTPQPSLRDFFGFGTPQQRPLVTQPPRAPGPPRPPANVGRSASNGVQ